MTDVSPDFVGRVERLSLRPTSENALMPLFEAVSNSLHAVDDRFIQEACTKALIKVEVLRADPSVEKSPVTGFIVEDNGIGLDDENYQSFRLNKLRNRAELAISPVYATAPCGTVRSRPHYHRR